MNKIDCLFINPRDLAAPAPYVKLAGIAGVLKKKGISFDLLEPAASNISYNDIIDLIKKRKPKIICLGAFPSTLPDAYTTVKLVKEYFPEIILVLEGYHVNADPEIVLHMGVHYGFRGDVEFVFAEFCEQILEGRQPDVNLLGLVINLGNSIKANEPAFIKDINELPLPAYEYLPIGKYYSASTTKSYMTVFTARGCPYDCNFCASAAQMTYRYLTIENTMKHLQLLVNDLNTTWIEFMDLTFTVSKKRTEELCDTIIENGLKFSWGCETRADKIDEHLLLKMKAAGCEKITIGVETGSEEIRYRTGKRISNARFEEVFKLCRKHGIKTMANFIFGHPGETEDDMRQTIQFAHRIKPFNILFTRMVPLPDVDIYTTGVQNGTVPKDVWIKYMKGEIAFPIAYPETIKPKVMDRIHRWAYLSFYLSPATILSYVPLFTDAKFFVRSLPIFFRLAFGKTIYK